MKQTYKLSGESDKLLEILFGMISSTQIDPLSHISELVQNGMDAEATNIKIIFYRRDSGKGNIEKISIEDNGFGFIESFEHYHNNIGNSIKKQYDIYLNRKREGTSRGEFCIGLQGFRAICDELHILNKTKDGMALKNENGKEINDPDFPKMFSNRKMILHSKTIDVTFEDGEDLKESRQNPGVTYTLINLKHDFKVQNLYKFLAQNKRTELMANKNLKINIIDGHYNKIVEPVKFSGEKIEFEQPHPRADENVKFRGLGKIKASLYFHQPKTGSKIRLDVGGEPLIYDLTTLDEFNRPPWNSGLIEGIIEYDRLTKSPLRSGVERDDTFWPAFLEMMEELVKKVEKKVKEYDDSSKKQKDEDLMKKLDGVMSDVKRELDFQTWFDRKTQTKTVGPLERIQVFPEVANVPAYTTRRVHVRAYDSDDNILSNKHGIDFEWSVINDMGSIIPQDNGEAIFKAGSKVGTTTINIIVKDKKVDKELKEKIEVVITHPPYTNGKLSKVRIEPQFSKIPLDKEREYTAVAEDEDRNQILKGVDFEWLLAYDDSNGASLNITTGESVILKPGKNKGSIKLQVNAFQNGRKASDFAIITVVEKAQQSKKKKKNAGLPILDHYNDAHEIPLRHSYLTPDGSKLFVNEGHRDYLNAKAENEKLRQRYIANCYAKELAEKECKETGSGDFGNKILDVLALLDRFWF